MRIPTFVIPAEAGIQYRPKDWIPAFAGMTGEGGGAGRRTLSARVASPRTFDYMRASPWACLRLPSEIAGVLRSFKRSGT